MMSENLRQRLDAIENSLRWLSGNNAAEQWRTLREMFCTSDTGDAELFSLLAANEGTRSLRRLLVIESPDTGQLRRRLGAFCQRNRVRCPEARVVKLRPIPGRDDGPAIVPTPGDDAFAFMQFFVSEMQS
jgi:hypothetical protein